MLGVINNVSERVPSNQSFCNIVQLSFIIESFFEKFASKWLGTWEKFIFAYDRKPNWDFIIYCCHNQKYCPEKINLIVVELQQLPKLEKVDLEKEMFFLNGKYTAESGKFAYRSKPTLILSKSPCIHTETIFMSKIRLLKLAYWSMNNFY